MSRNSVLPSALAMPPDLSGLLLGSFAQAHRYVRLPARAHATACTRQVLGPRKWKSLRRTRRLRGPRAGIRDVDPWTGDVNQPISPASLVTVSNVLLVQQLSRVGGGMLRDLSGILDILV